MIAASGGVATVHVVPQPPETPASPPVVTRRRARPEQGSRPGRPEIPPVRTPKSQPTTGDESDDAAERKRQAAMAAHPSAVAARRRQELIAANAMAVAAQSRLNSRMPSSGRELLIERILAVGFLFVVVLGLVAAGLGRNHQTPDDVVQAAPQTMEWTPVTRGGEPLRYACDGQMALWARGEPMSSWSLTAVAKDPYCIQNERAQGQRENLLGWTAHEVEDLKLEIRCEGTDLMMRTANEEATPAFTISARDPRCEVLPSDHPRRSPTFMEHAR